MLFNQLPGHWQAALEAIANEPRRLYIGVLCLPGGQRTADELVAFGAIEIFPDRIYCTLTPWAAQTLLGVEPWEFRDFAQPAWVRSGVVQAIADTPLVSRGSKGVLRLPWIYNVAGRSRPWFTDGDPSAVQAEPVRDEWENEITLFKGAPLFHESDLKKQHKAEVKMKRAAKKEAKAKKIRRAG